MSEHDATTATARELERLLRAAAQIGRFLADRRRIALRRAQAASQDRALAAREATEQQRRLAAPIWARALDDRFWARAQIEEAARAARVHDVIAALPQGYDTVVDSSRLSGGERQRLGIARALLADTPVVILDEATASADPDSELEIRRALSTLLKGRTVLMIAHRLHTVRDAERIVVMDHGRVVETGTHASLMAADGVYAAMWAATGSPETSADGGERREVAIW